MSRSTRAAALAAVALALFTGGCATPETRAVLDDPGELRPRAEITSAPFFPQSRYQCGPAAIAMALAWSGDPVTPDEMVPEVYTPAREGTFAADMVSVARRRGRLAAPVTGLAGILAEIAAENPVVVFQNLGLDLLPKWHFALAVGYDLADGTITLRSGREARRVISLATFERTWARAGRWALTVLPPDVLPATGTATTVARAAAALERAGRPAAARAAYGAMLRRWPDDLAALIGLGNTSYALGDLAAAESAFRRASARRPREAAAHNNLAHVLGRLGRTVEAIAAARRAVDLAPGDPTPFLQTLRELTGNRAAGDRS